MDSGNSGSLSLQSSSGGDDELDSRCGEDSSPLSALLRQPPAPSSSVLPGFGGSSFYGINDLATPPMSHWSATTTPLPAGASTAPHSSSCHGAPAPASANHEAVALAPAQQAPAAAPAARASRKRTRASRRAPTTVLTTDTSNFRAMVQEFTGVPAPPFAGAASARSSRSFDHLFPSPYLLRPFAHKLQAQAAASPYIATSSSASKAIATSTAPRTTTAVASGDSYHQLASAPSNVLGMQDHGSSGVNYLSFQSPMLDGNNNNASRTWAAHHMFDAAGPPSGNQRLPDPAGFSGLAHGQMNSRHRDHGGDELSGLVGAASVSKAADAGSASRVVPPRLERNALATTTAAMRAQGVESSWICTSE